MKNKLLCIAFLFSLESNAQIRGMLEQIYYYDQDGGLALGPIAQIQNHKNWYAEARYNYEEARTISFYLGKVYSKEGIFEYSVVPLFGGVVGRFNGGSVGLNVDFEYKQFYFSSQSQYTFSLDDEINNFYFSWSELGYQPLNWLYGGMAVQETYFPQTAEQLFHPGFVVGFSFRQWTFPLYGFKTGKSAEAFICSIIYEW